MLGFVFICSDEFESLELWRIFALLSSRIFLIWYTESSRVAKKKNSDNSYSIIKFCEHIKSTFSEQLKPRPPGRKRRRGSKSDNSTL